MGISLTTAEKLRIRDQKLKQMAQQKLELYGLEKTAEENKILEEALTELAVRGKTDIVCPRCKNALVLLTADSSSELKCLNNEICIKIISRGI